MLDYAYMNTDVRELLSRGVTEIIGKEDLEKRLAAGEKLRIKLGIDPTSPDLHLGRAIPLLKLRDFQKLGHQIVFIVGDFTATIGDASDKDSERPMLTEEQVEHNKKTYFEQVGKIIDLEKTELRRNSEWLEALTNREIVRQASVFSLSDFISRENIKKRLDEGKRIGLHEVIYPLMQGYDSVAVEADVEIGGTDQRFNLLAGRTLQEEYGQKPQSIIMGPIINGLDGRKMSSSWGNTIKITAAPQEMYGLVMSMSDDLIEIYFELCTRVPMDEVKEIMSGHPKVAKERLAKEIVTMYHGADAAEDAAKNFLKPGSAEEISLEEEATFKTLAEKLKLSNTEMRRLIEAGAVETEEGKKIENIDEEIESGVYRVGKHRFVKISLS